MEVEGEQEQKDEMQPQQPPRGISAAAQAVIRTWETMMEAHSVRIAFFATLLISDTCSIGSAVG